MTKNPILDELHTIRERLLAESGGTLSALVSRLQAEQKLSGRMLIRTKQCTEADNAIGDGSSTPSTQ